MEDDEYTVASVLHRTITVHGSGDRSERYSLFRFASGDVYWRLDEFDHVEDPADPRWLASRGRLTVSAVARRLPDHAQTVIDWTLAEIELGTVVADDIFSAMRREEALERLRREHDDAAALRAP